MLRLASLSILTLVSSLSLLACNPAVIADSTGGAGGTGGTSTSSTGGQGGGADTCTPAGGTCIAIVPDACWGGTWGDPATCGGGVGVGCCFPKPATTCEAQGGTCVPIVPDACQFGTWGDPTTCTTGEGVGCCLPQEPSCGFPCTTPGEQRCIVGVVEICGSDPLTNCAPVWRNPMSCGANEQCSSDGVTCVPISSTCGTSDDCGCGCGCVVGECKCTGAIPPSCTVDTDCGPSCSGLRCVAGKCEQPVCEPGADQSCNENLSMSSFAGKCNADATCTCKAPFTKKASGKCG